MEIIERYWGSGEPLSSLQMGCRGIVIFIIALVILRISGRRSFGVGTPLDNIVVILLGAILSRAITGASPFWPVVAASLMIALLHRFFSWCKVYSEAFGKLVEGDKIVLYENNDFNAGNMSRAQVAREDIMQAVREAQLPEDMQQVSRVYMERNGNITVVRKQEQ